jgi:hypothetical protein
MMGSDAKANFREMQSEKASSPIEVTEGGISIATSAMHDVKALHPNETTAPVNLIETSLLQ